MRPIVAVAIGSRWRCEYVAYNRRQSIRVCLPHQVSCAVTIYLWTKTFHLLFVIGFMACVFYLPRILVNLAETQGQDTVQARLVLMGLRLYRFGHVMFAAALLFGLPLWLGYKEIGRAHV